MLVTDNRLIGKQSYSNGSTVIMEKRTGQARVSAEGMKHRFGVFILCFLLSLMCIACGNTDFKEESNVANTTVKEYEVSSSEMNKGLNENDSLQQDADIELGTEKTEKETDLYVGEYNSYDVNEPNLQIRKNDDGTYLIQIGIYRLTQLDNCIGVEVDDRIEFSTTEWGETNVITGTITVEDDVATVKLLAEWSDTWFKDTDEYKYYKTSNIPNIYEYVSDDGKGSLNSKKDEQGLTENLEMTSEELFDLFLEGSIDAIDSTDMTSTFNIKDLNMNSEEWDSYSIGERVDLDNDGEYELILCGPYGGIYLDARDNKVYEFATGDGNANELCYTYYNGEIWIMYSNRTNAEYRAYHLVKYEGANNMCGEMNLSEELVDANNPEAGMKYILNGKEVSYDFYNSFRSKITAAEMYTD